MANSITTTGRYRLIVEDTGKFVSNPIVALGKTERPTMAQLQSYLPALGIPGRRVEFALFWSAEDDPEMKNPVFVASAAITLKWADYALSRESHDSFVDYLNRITPVLSIGESEEEVSVDVVRYIFNRADMSPQESMNLIVRPPHVNSTEYEQLIARPGEIFMLLLYVEKRLNYYLVSRHLDIVSMYGDIAAAQSEGSVSAEWFNAWWAKLEPLQMSLVAKNSDKNFSGLVSALAQETSGILPDDLRKIGVDNLEELVDIRNAIGHSTIYNGLVVDGKVMIAPHLTKHTGRSNQQTLTAQLDDETYDLIKSMVEDAHTFLEICAKAPLREPMAPDESKQAESSA